MYDVIIIGAGVSGCAVARELSRYQLKIAVLDKESDVCEGTSKANSAIVHGGFDAKPGTLMAKLNVAGNRMMEEMAKKLDFPFVRNGSMVVCTAPEGVAGLEKLLEQGRQNGVEGMRILDRSQALELEPNLADGVYAALHIPSAGIICPFSMNIAYAENAAENGAEFFLQTKVETIIKTEAGYQLQTSKGMFESRFVINAAGVYADVFHNMVSERKIHITARRGDYCLLDKTAGNLVSHTIFMLPGPMGKGVLVTPTVHGNLLVGPTAVDVEDKENTATTRQGLQTLQEKCALSVKNVPMRQVITSFAGLRAHEDGHEFIIEEAADAQGFIDVAGIESPGLTSAPAIGVYVRDLMASLTELKEKEDFIEERKGLHLFMDCSAQEQQRMLEKNPAYGQIVCRCELVTEGDIMAAIHRPLGATTLDGVKRRTRAGMGRCQAGFCTPKTMEILARECSRGQQEICKNNPPSRLIVGTNKDRIGEV
ncbi:MAG: NAD(P)/FAD-dependent oxidoreductase [Lachnospiraceae bacterium]|nr:NAD(P)/FAD-dependent oxidoreductase [Lachnospiraceae bacterium]